MPFIILGLAMGVGLLVLLSMDKPATVDTDGTGPPGQPPGQPPLPQAGSAPAVPPPVIQPSAAAALPTLPAHLEPAYRWLEALVSLARKGGLFDGLSLNDAKVAEIGLKNISTFAAAGTQIASGKIFQGLAQVVMTILAATELPGKIQKEYAASWGLADAYVRKIGPPPVMAWIMIARWGRGPHAIPHPPSADFLPPTYGHMVILQAVDVLAALASFYRLPGGPPQAWTPRDIRAMGQSVVNDGETPVPSNFGRTAGMLASPDLVFSALMPDKHRHALERGGLPPHLRFRRWVGNLRPWDQVDEKDAVELIRALGFDGRLEGQGKRVGIVPTKLSFRLESPDDAPISQVSIKLLDRITWVHWDTNPLGGWMNTTWPPARSVVRDLGADGIVAKADDRDQTVSVSL